MPKLNFHKLRCRLEAAWWCLSAWQSTPGRARFQLSFSQSGEDLILWRLFHRLKIPNPYYVDIGAHHPTRWNNTRLFCFTGSRGINVEPNPDCFRLFQSQRRRDLNLNVGVALEEGKLPFFKMTDPLLSTFNPAEAERMIEEGSAHLESTLTLPVYPLGWVLEHAQAPVDLLSLDTEGMDLPILRSLETGPDRPKIICVESIPFSSKGPQEKVREIESVMTDKGYRLVADTRINSIYLRDDLAA